MKELFGGISEFMAHIGNIDEPCLFRGQSSSRFGLLPSIGRTHPRYTPSLDIEQDLLNQFRMKAIAFRQLPTDSSELDWLILARHYGLRTRLLDWTSNPHVALYFAIQDRSSSESFPLAIYIAKSPPTVSYFDLRNQPLKVDTTSFFEPPFLDQRVANQHSYLSLHHSPLEEFSADYIERFNIQPDRHTVTSIERLLHQIGLKHAGIFPGLEGLCRDINDNPSNFERQLIVSRPKAPEWKVIPRIWITKALRVTEQRLVAERSFDEFLDWNSGPEVVGVPLEINGKVFGRFFGYDASTGEVWIYEYSTGAIVPYLRSDSLFWDIKVAAETIAQIFPNKGIHFRTRRPIPAAGAKVDPREFASDEYFHTRQIAPIEQDREDRRK